MSISEFEELRYDWVESILDFIILVKLSVDLPYSLWSDIAALYFIGDDFENDWLFKIILSEKNLDLSDEISDLSNFISFC